MSVVLRFAIAVTFSIGILGFLMSIATFVDERDILLGDCLIVSALSFGFISVSKSITERKVD